MSRKNIEVVVHINETLNKPSISSLESKLSKEHGIEKVHINPVRQHLMMVDYSPENVNMRQVLGYVNNNGLHAKLIGGI